MGVANQPASVINWAPMLAAWAWVCRNFWDALLPPESALIASCAAPAEGGCALLYSAADQSLICGGQRGEVLVYDVRQRRQRLLWTAHTLATRALAMHEKSRRLVSASSDGDLKVWYLGGGSFRAWPTRA